MLELIVDRRQRFAIHDRAQHRGDLQGEVGSLAGVVDRRRQRDLRERHRLRAAAADVFFGQRLVAGVLEREILQRMRGPVRVHQVAGDHRVGLEPAHHDAVPLEQDRVELQVVPDLPDRRIFEHRPQHVERLAGAEAAGRLRLAVEREAAVRAGRYGRTAGRERDVARLARRGRERQPDDRRAHRRRRVGQHAQREASRGAEVGRERRDAFARVDRLVVLPDGLRRRREVHHQGAEAEAREQVEAALARAAAVAHRLGVELDRAVDVDPRQRAALPRVLGVIDEAFALPLVLDLARVGQQVFEIAVLGDQIAGPLLADPGHALDVVDRVAHQREHVDDLPGRDAELLLHRRGVVPGAFFLRVVDLEAVVHQLVEVLVSRDDRHLESRRDRLGRQRPDHVVGLVALRREDRHAHRLAGLVHPGNLLGEIARHRRAVGLVVGGDEGGKLQYIIRQMLLRVRAAAVAIVLAASVAACNSRGGPLGTEYEYEEDLTLSLNGSATLVVNASISALVALRGLPLNPDPRTRGDQLKEQIQALYASPYTRVGRISAWTRHGRRFVGIHLSVSDVRALWQTAPFSWAKIELREQGEQVVFRETLSKPAAPPDALAKAGLTGNEIVAFRLHLPARIRFQNSHYLDRPESRPTSRGNILTWEQRFGQRLAGLPIAYAEDRTSDVMEVRTDRASILYRTLWLFALAFATALLVIAGLIWLTIRRAPADPGPSSPPPSA